MTSNLADTAVATATQAPPSQTELTELVKESLALAEQWQRDANAALTPFEKKHQQKMNTLIRRPKDKVAFAKMIDQSFRASNTGRVANQLTYILNEFGIPEFFKGFELLGLHLLLNVGALFHAIFIPVMIIKMRQESDGVILPGEKAPLYRHLAKRKSEGIRMNVNQIGEAMLGEEDALERFENYKKYLRDPNIEYISIKITTIYSQVNHIAYDYSIQRLEERLAELYKISQENEFTRPDGTVVKKFINLDMEEYRDLELTYELFVKTLDRPELKDCMAGIVFQAYLPDSLGYLKRLTAWAKNRVANGGSPVKVRIVKGANMEMEHFESVERGWPQAPYSEKVHTDANYKRMLEYAMQPENIKAVRLGIASHNIFEQAYAYKLAERNEVKPYFVFEMLEGMALHVTRVVRKYQDVLLYAPVTEKEGFINAIGYLIRRLDENTGPENFLSYSFGIDVGDENWEKLKGIFLTSLQLKDKVYDGSYRFQNRNTETFDLSTTTEFNDFELAPDTDFSLHHNVQWAEAIRDRWKPNGNIHQVPVVVGGEEILEGRDVRESIDRSAAPEKVVTTQYRLATLEDANRAVEVAKADPDGWRQKSSQERAEILYKVAQEVRVNRGNLMGATMLSTGKSLLETDPEVSEAVDFAEFYPRTIAEFEKLGNVQATPKGVALVVPPWNFPVAIPLGGVAASLAAGNTVIIKPSSEAVLVDYELCQCFWRAGVSKNTLQFVPCSGATVGAEMVKNPGVDFVILTGGTETALQMLEDRPTLQLYAETGGKNATIVSAMSDRDQAIKNLLHSAFSNAGQKCSCTSLLLLEREVFEDKKFRKTLKDAVESMHVGSTWDYANKVGPLIQAPKGDLKKAIENLEPGEFWLIEPKMVDNNPYIWRPSIRWNVKPGSFTHMTELFGPVLSVMCYDKLEDAINLVNQTGFGLTSGIESLDPRELKLWKDKINAGNLYVNRGTTGAIVLRQPFGGRGKSGFGMGMKAGGPNYVTQLMNFTETASPTVDGLDKANPMVAYADSLAVRLQNGQLADHKADLEKAVAAIRSYVYNMQETFSKEWDYFKLFGQDNILRYQPLGTVVVRVTAQDTLFETVARIAAAKIANNSVVVSLAQDVSEPVAQFLKSADATALLEGTSVVSQSDAELYAQFGKVARVRYAAPDRVPAEAFDVAKSTGFYIDRDPVMQEGRIELLHYLREQSISENYHRYGNIGERGLKD